MTTPLVPLTSEELSALKTLAEAAATIAPGSWDDEEGPEGFHTVITRPSPFATAFVARAIKRIARYIAAANPSVLLRLLAQLQEAEARWSEAKAWLRKEQVAADEDVAAENDGFNAGWAGALSNVNDAIYRIDQGQKPDSTPSLERKSPPAQRELPVMIARTKGLHDPRWDPIAREWLEDCGIPDAVIDRHVYALAQSLHDRAEDYVDSDLPDDERLREEAAHDAYVNRLIDEARGK